MNATNFLPNPRQALVPMCKALLDALVLGTLIAVILIYSTVVLTLPWLIIVGYALTYLIAVAFRLRKAAKSFPAEYRERQATALEETAFTMIQGWMDSKRRTPPEEY